MQYEIFILIEAVLSFVAWAFWRRWVGGWGGDISKPLKMFVLFCLAAIMFRDAIWLVLPIFGVLSVWFLVRGDNGKHHVFRYGWCGIGYLLEPVQSCIPAMPYIGVRKYHWTEVAELWLGGSTALTLMVVRPQIIQLHDWLIANVPVALDWLIGL